MGGGDAPASHVDMKVLPHDRNTHLCNAPMHTAHSGEFASTIGKLVTNINRMSKSMLLAIAHLGRKTFHNQAKQGS
jgi:hypothetical protein